MKLLLFRGAHEAACRGHGTPRIMGAEMGTATHMVPVLVPLAPHARVVKVVSMVLIIHIATCIGKHCT